ncbi:sigma-70 family RNA polymerase sigma factor [Micromonospora sp. ALFpr18c]|uniref:sigma-70 family RNA polymerase sigma factor n=1 Tax=unclassified Micromonospora TaxID=2617518 RepID=UPI001CEDD606|nr:sigma-70 family RNA polymerase sigma factor [Micromonospora sp. ALFpr18c]
MPPIDDTAGSSETSLALRKATDDGAYLSEQGDATSPLDGMAALRHLQLVHRPVLLAYAIRLANGDRHWAEDIVQETMVRAWQHPDARNEGGRWNRAWLFTVARRIAIDNVRAAQVRPLDYTDEIGDATSDESAEERFARDLDSQYVRRAVASLPERLRTTLIQLYFLNHSIAEAAENLDIPPGTVKSRSFHALRALRKALSDQGFNAGSEPDA